MPSFLSNKKKTHKLLSLVKNYEPQKNAHQFVRSYSQLLNRHFSQSIKQKSSLRKSLSSSNGFRTKKNKKSLKHHQDHQHDSNQFHKDTMNEKNSGQTLNICAKNETLDQSVIEGSHNPQIFSSQSFKKKKLEMNAQMNLKLEKILMSKTQLLQKNSHQNVLLNQKLHQSTHEKKALMTLMQNLRLEILKEKKIKAKISTNMGKLMNKIEQANNSIRKTEEERFFIKQENHLVEKDVHIETKKNIELTTISEINKEKISIEKEIINSLNNQNERTKAQFFEARTHLNEIKEIYMRESKCLLKVEMNKNQSLQEMNLLCKTVEQSVANAKETSKR